MASTSAVVYLRPRFSSGTAGNRSTGAVVFFPFRDVSGIYVGAGIGTDNSAASEKSMLPGPRVQLVDEKGYIRPEWWRFFNWLLNTKLGGMASPSITDVASSVTTVQTAITSTVTAVTELTDQAAQNAAVLNTVREVAINSDLDGAEQIDNPVLQRKGLY